MDTEKVVCGSLDGEEVRVHVPKKRSRLLMASIELPIWYSQSSDGEKACRMCGSHLAEGNYSFSPNFVCDAVGGQHHLRGCDFAACEWRGKGPPIRSLPSHR